MDNAKYSYEVFIQNSLDATSHTLEWLPTFTKPDPNFSDFMTATFLMGTHHDQEGV